MLGEPTDHTVRGAGFPNCDGFITNMHLPS